MASLAIRSPAFSPGGPIPVRHTGDGDDVSPPLEWSGVPKGAKTLALVVDDPDAPDPRAPKRLFAHWVLYNLPPDARGLPEGVRTRDLPHGTRVGKNDWGRTAYGGPCPPVGQHRYFHKLFALDVVLDLVSPTAKELAHAIEGHVLATAEVIGVYQRPAGAAEC
jgi:Raf kinase inhibitor-like YbhB/YbcL family protein